MLPVFNNFWIKLYKIEKKYLKKIETFKQIDTIFHHNKDNGKNLNKTTL